MPIATTAILATTAAIGIGTSIYGAVKQQEGYDKMKEGYEQSAAGYRTQQEAANRIAGYQKNIIADEQKQEGIRRQSMELDAKRNILQVTRQAQAARAMSLATATAQGAGFYSEGGVNSGLAGSQAQINASSMYNINGINQALYAGRSMFDLNADISQQRIGISDAGTLMAQGQGQVAMGQGMVGLGQGMSAQGAGYMSLGGSLVSAAGTFGNLAGNMKGFGNPFGGGGYGASSMTYNPGMSFNPGSGSSYSY